MSLRVVIIGGGFAGAAAGYFLSREQNVNITLLEADWSPGVHASGRNAALIRQLSTDPLMTHCEVESAKLLLSLEKEWDIPLRISRAGSILAMDSATAEKCLAAASGATFLFFLPFRMTAALGLFFGTLRKKSISAPSPEAFWSALVMKPIGRPKNPPPIHLRKLCLRKN